MEGEGGIVGVYGRDPVTVQSVMAGVFSIAL
jgi:hypothetical protein